MKTRWLGGEAFFWVILAGSLVLHAAVLGRNPSKRRPPRLFVRPDLTSVEVVFSGPGPGVTEGVLMKKTGVRATGTMRNPEGPYPRQISKALVSDFFVDPWPSTFSVDRDSVRFAALPSAKEKADRVVYARRVVDKESDPIEESSSRRRQPEQAVLAADFPNNLHRGVRQEARPLTDINPPLVYPERALRHGWEGTVSLKVWVSDQGMVERVEIERSSGYRLLDRSALEAIQRWRFAPAQMEGRNIASIARLPVVFDIKDPAAF